MHHEDFVQRILKQKTNDVKNDPAVLPTLTSEALPETLTDREEEVAKLAADGLRNKEIALQLQISPWTVKNHLQSIYTKLNIDRRSKLGDLLR